MGVKSLYEYFYKLAYGDKGADKATLVNDCLDVADAEIKANKNARHTQGTDYSNIVICANYDHPDDAITAIGASNKTLLVTEAETCDTNFTVPANVTVKFERGGKWTIATGITVTFNGQIEAGLWQIFEYVGTGTLAGTPNVNYVYPEWWGAVADGTTNDSGAIINAFALFSRVSFSNASYAMESGVTKTGSNIKVDFGNAKIIANFAGSGYVFTFGTSGDTPTYTGLDIKGGYFELETPASANNVVYMCIKGTKKFSIKNTHLRNVSNGGILIEAGCEDGVIDNVTIDGISGYGTCRGIWLNGSIASDYAEQLVDISSITRNATALPVYAVENVKIINCTITMTAYSIYLMNTRDIHIENNYIDITGGAQRCISVNTYSPRTIIKGNTLIGSQTSSGILVSQFSHDVLIDGNIFKGSFGGGRDIYLAYLANALITNNRFNTNSTQQILIDMGAKGIIRNNSFTRSAYAANHRAIKIVTIDEVVAGTGTYGDTATMLAGSIIENNVVSVRVVPALVSPQTSNAGRIPGLEAVIVRNNVFYDFDTAAASDEYGMRISGSTGTTYKIKYVYINNRMYPESDNDHNKVSIAGAGTINVTGYIYYSGSNPTVNDDIDLGYLVGSRWINTTTDKEYVCVNNADGAAVWKETTNDYSEGEWTPAITFGGASVDMTYTTQAGLYTKIGKQVAVTCYILLSAKGTSTGDALITGLPFASKNDNGAYVAVTLRLQNITFANTFMGHISKNTTAVNLTEVTEAGVVTALDNADFVNNSSVMVSATYFTD